jgi:uncharacterized protein (DUF433 family)
VARTDLDALRRTPAYPFAEAAHYLGVPKSALRAWCVGQAYKDRHGDRKTFRPLIRLDGASSEGLSFLNLVESHVLAAIRRKHEIPLPKIRRALEFVVKRLDIARPLANARFQTNGVDLFVEELGQLVNVNRDGQVEIADLMRAHLDRVTWDDAGLPIRLYPFTRRSESGKAPMPVVMDPRVAFGRPVLVDRAVPTAVLADRFKAGDRLSELAKDYDTSTEAIEEAIRCELDRREAA